MSEALDTARKVGDDFRYSATASNLCSLHILRGDFREAVAMGRLSLDVGLTIPNQPNLMSSYTNLAEAHMLLGEQREAVRCIESAKEWMGIQRSWRANVNFLCESANIALMMGNLSLALQLTEAAEAVTGGRERLVPEAGMFWKLRILRAEYATGAERTSEMAKHAQELFRGRHAVYFLETLAAKAWLDGVGTPRCPDRADAARLDALRRVGSQRAVRFSCVSGIFLVAGQPRVIRLYPRAGFAHAWATPRPARGVCGEGSSRCSGNSGLRTRDDLATTLTRAGSN